MSDFAKALSFSFFILFFMDAAATYLLVSQFGMEEANPVMAYFLSAGWLCFFLAKASLTMLGLTLFVAASQTRIVVSSMFLVWVVYFATCIYHCYIFAFLTGGIS